MLYLLLAILSSSAVAVLMRLSGKYSKNGMTMLASNYLMCTVFAALLAGWPLLPAGEGLGVTLALGGVSGVMYLAGFVLLRWTMGRSGVVLPATFQKLGIVLPTLAAMTLFGEAPRWPQLVGMAVAVVAIVVMQGKADISGSAGRAGLPGLLALMIVCGSCDLMAKVFEQWGNPAHNDHYLLFTFLTAFALCVALCGVKRQGVTCGDVLCGLAIGVPNYLSARFLLGALGSVPAMVVYPTFSVGAILLVTAVGVLAFREKLDRRKAVAQGMILVALALLNL